MEIKIEIFSFSVILSLLLGSIQWCISIWIKSRLEKSIEHEYNKKLEEFKFSISVRAQAAEAAKLFAKYIKYNAREDEVLNEDKRRDHFEELNKLNWELAIWIPKEEIVKKINEVFLRKPGADIKQIIIEIREVILGEKCKVLKAGDLVHFTVK